MAEKEANYKARYTWNEKDPGAQNRKKTVFSGVEKQHREKS